MIKRLNLGKLISSILKWVCVKFTGVSFACVLLLFVAMLCNRRVCLQLDTHKRCYIQSKRIVCINSCCAVQFGGEVTVLFENGFVIYALCGIR